LKYSIDTSAILDAWVRGFPPEVMPGLWKQLEELIDNGQLIATEEVLYELKKKEDEVYKWAKSHETMFVPTDEQIQIAVTEILRITRNLSILGKIDRVQTLLSSHWLKSKIVR